jgi:TolA-binding protein
MEAIQAYGQIVRWVRAADSADNVRPEDRERNARLLERAVFFVGFCYGRMQEPADQLDQFRQRAIASYSQFLEQYPNASLAPPAMRDLGAMYLARGDSAAATRTFEQLAERYPNSDEGRNALFALVSAAFEINEPEIARRAFQGMIASPDTYSAEEFTRVGQLMLDNGLYEDVIPAYQRVVETTDQRQMLELALYGLGSAFAQQQHHAESARVLRDLLERFPNTSFYFDARFTLARALAATGDHEAAMSPLIEIMRMSQDNLVIQRAQFQMGLIQRQQGNRQAALATFQRIALLQDPQIRELRPIIEQSLLDSLELMMEMELFADVDDVAAQYLSDFAQGQGVDKVRATRAEAVRRRAL